MNKDSKPFNFLPHTADIKFRAKGRTLQEVFINSAMAVKETVTTSNIEKKITKGVGIEGDDLESLMYNFLEEIIFLIDSENFIISSVEKFHIAKEEDSWMIKCEFVGDRTSGKDDRGKKYQFSEHIKGITYHEMKIEGTKEGFIAEVVLDV